VNYDKILDSGSMCAAAAWRLGVFCTAELLGSLTESGGEATIIGRCFQDQSAWTFEFSFDCGGHRGIRVEFVD